jgi:DNA transposition AAA+ family ATPase
MTQTAITALSKNVSKDFESSSSLVSPLSSEWIDLPTSQRILGALSYAQTATDIVVIHGGPGLGKTRALKQFVVDPQSRTSRKNLWHVTLTPATAGLVPAMIEICTVLGMPALNGAGPLHRAIVSHVAGKGGLLAIDEAQHLTSEALDQLRAIHDATGVGLVLMGSRALRTRLFAGREAATLDCLRSRIGKCLHVVGITQEDIDMVLDHWRITNRVCRATLSKIGAKPTALHGLIKVLSLISSWARAERRSIADTDVRAAWRELGGP